MSDTDDELLDADLHEEIALVGDVVAAVAEFDGPLDEDEIDRALGVIDSETASEGDDKSLPPDGRTDGAA